ncbi:hypothetical protein EOM57_01165 [Candidatus Saccharibacteria bacterium]|nr:hypothetical protein [Candidatus Saccharibacteria bacterium]
MHQYASTAALLSGNWNNGSQAGAFYLNLNNAASNRNYNISGRAQYVHHTRKLKMLRPQIVPCPLAKHKKQQQASLVGYSETEAF